MSSVRKLINNRILINELIKESSKWNKLCSSLDTIEDKDRAICFYESIDQSTSKGQMYLSLDGLLQGLYVQQDALFNLCKIIGLDKKKYKRSELEAIRNIRNKASGHPTDKNCKGGSSSNYIVRHSLKKDYFELISYLPDNHMNHEIFNPLQLIIDQRKEVLKILDSVNDNLIKRIEKHKEKFVMEKLAEIIPESLDYTMTKIMEATIDPNKIPQYHFHIDIINKSIAKFKDKIEERGRYTKNEIRGMMEYIEYSIEGLIDYFNQEVDYIEPKTAYIFADFLQRGLKELNTIAVEIDEDYSTVESA